MENNISQDDIKKKILEKILKIIPFKGWGVTALQEATKKAGFDEKIAELILLNGVDDLIDLYFLYLDNEMLKSVSQMKIENLKIRERIFESIKARIKLLAKDKAVVIKTISYLSLPWKLPLSSRMGWRTMDLIWYEICDDCSTDFNYYTKRFLLYMVYTSTILYWLSDNSHDYNDTFDFLKRKIDDVLKVGGFINKLKKTYV